MSKGADTRVERTGWPGRVRKVASIVDTDETTFRSTVRRILESRRLTWPIADAAIVYAGYAGALLLRFRGDVPPESWQRFAYVLPFIAAGYLLANVVFGGYRAGWRYSVFKDVGGLLIGVTLVTGVVFGVNSSLSHRDIPLSVNLLGGALIFLSMWAVRGWPQLVKDRAQLVSERYVAPQATEISAVYRGALGLAALFVLGVGVWFSVEISIYEPGEFTNGRIMVYMSHFMRDPSLWFEGQAPFLQYFTYISLVKLFGWGGHLVVVTILFSAALAVLVGYIAYRVSGGKLWAFLTSVLLLISLPVFLDQAGRLPFYAPLLFFGYGGLFATVTYARYGGRAALVLGALGLAGALYSYAFGLFFLVIPLLYMLPDHGRAALVRLGRVYAVVAALAAPWFVWHLAAQGLGGLHRQRLSWMVDQGYTRIKNIEVVGVASQGRLEFLTERLPEMLENAAGPLIFILVPLTVIGIMRLPTWSWRTAAVLALVLPIGAMAYRTPPAFGRYIYFLMPALVILSVYGLDAFLRLLSSYRRTAHLSSAAAIIILGLLGAVYLYNVQDEVAVAHRRYSEPAQSELTLIAEMVDDGKAVAGARLGVFGHYEHESPLLGPDFVSEEDFVTYLTWPSEEAVAQMFARNNVGWVLVRRNAEYAERDYYSWLRVVVGQLPQHYLKIKRSGLVEKVYGGTQYLLYRVPSAGLLATASPESGAR